MGSCPRVFFVDFQHICITGVNPFQPIFAFHVCLHMKCNTELTWVNKFHSLTLSAPTPQNGQTHWNNLLAVTNELFLTNCLSKFDHLVGLALKKLNLLCFFDLASCICPTTLRKQLIGSVLKNCLFKFCWKIANCHSGKQLRWRTCFDLIFWSYHNCFPGDLQNLWN